MRARRFERTSSPGRPAPSAAGSVQGGRTRRSQVGIALAGGGPLGGIYEIGALAAIADSLEGLDLNDLDVYVGVSSGSFVAAGLANGITPLEMVHMFIESEDAREPFDPAILVRPAFREYLSRAASVPPLLLSSLKQLFTRPGSQDLLAAFQRLSRAIPTGVFNNAEMERFLRRMFSAPGRTNDFRRLGRKLYLVATDLDSGESVEFGAPGQDTLPISRAVQASAALPGLFPPVRINGRYYVDGALIKTLHASVALKEGARLVLCINPLVPFSDRAADKHVGARRLVDGGLPVVLSQTFRAIIHSRMQAGLAKYEQEFRGKDVILFEPRSDDADMFFTNIFSYAGRRRLCEHAYQRTRAEILARRHELAPLLARHGIRLNRRVLQDENLHLVRPSVRSHSLRSTPALDAAARLADGLDDLEHWLRVHSLKPA